MGVNYTKQYFLWYYVDLRIQFGYFGILTFQSSNILFMKLYLFISKEVKSLFIYVIKNATFTNGVQIKDQPTFSSYFIPTFTFSINFVWFIKARKEALYCLRIWRLKALPTFFINKTRDLCVQLFNIYGHAINFLATSFGKGWLFPCRGRVSTSRIIAFSFAFVAIQRLNVENIS